MCGPNSFLGSPVSWLFYTAVHCGTGHAERTRRVYIYSSLVDSRLIVQTHPVVSDLSSSS